MIGVVVMVLELLIFAEWGRRRVGAAVAPEVAAYLREVDARGRAGAANGARATPAGLEAQWVRETLVAAEKRGLRVGGAVRAMVREIARAGRHAGECRRLWKILQGRAALAVGGAALARLWLLSQGGGGEGGGEDVAALSLAVGLMAVGQIVMVKALRPPWVGAPRLGGEAKLWLSAHFEGGGASAAPRPWIREIQELQRRQIREGVSLAVYIDQALAAVAREKRLATRIARERLQDLMPIFELLTVGLPAGLMILAPMLDNGLQRF